MKFRNASIEKTEKREDRFNYIDIVIFNILNSDYGHNVVLGGGALQTAFNDTIKVNDYDLFFINDGLTWDATVDATRTQLEDEGFNCVFECPAGDLYTYMLDDVKVQLITKFKYSSVNQLLNTFDFRCVMIALNKNILTFTRGALKDTIKKELRINVITFPVATLSRIMKYKYRKGFSVRGDTLIQFIMEVNEMNIDESMMALYVD